MTVEGAPSPGELTNENERKRRRTVAIPEGKKYKVQA